MPAKYSHAKKKLVSGQQHSRKPNNTSKSTSYGNGSNSSLSSFHGHGHAHRNPTPHLDRTISQAMSAVSELERVISRILLLRYEHDIARLYSTRLHSVALVYLPKLMLDCTVAAASPSWVAANAECDDVKDFFRAAIAMDLRQAGERVATKSVLWSYTALRHFVSTLIDESIAMFFDVKLLNSCVRYGRLCRIMYQYAQNEVSILCACSLIFRL